MTENKDSFIRLDKSIRMDIRFVDNNTIIGGKFSMIMK